MSRPDPNGRACVDCAHFRPAHDSINDWCRRFGFTTSNARFMQRACGDEGKAYEPAAAPAGGPRPPLRIA